MVATIHDACTRVILLQLCCGVNDIVYNYARHAKVLSLQGRGGCSLTGHFIATGPVGILHLALQHCYELYTQPPSSSSLGCALSYVTQLIAGQVLLGSGSS